MTDEKELTDEQLQEKMDVAGITNDDMKAVRAYLALGIEQDDGIKDFEEAYSGQFISDEKFAEDMADGTGVIPAAGSSAWPLYCIDWEWAARELMMDYSEEDGYYFRNM